MFVHPSSVICSTFSKRKALLSLCSHSTEELLSGFKLLMHISFKTVRQREERALSSAWLWHCGELQGCGFCCQVEYCPCVIANDCWNLLMEFMQSFMGSHTPGIPSVFGTKHDSIYSPADTMVQYMELFNKIRKQQQVPVAGIRWKDSQSSVQNGCIFSADHDPLEKAALQSAQGFFFLPNLFAPFESKGLECHEDFFLSSSSFFLLCVSALRPMGRMALSAVLHAGDCRLLAEESQPDACKGQSLTECKQLGERTFKYNIRVKTSCYFSSK